MEAAGIKPSSIVAKRVDALILRLRRRQLVGSHAVATEVVKVLRDVVAASRINSFETLTEVVEDVGRRLSIAGKKEPVIPNMVLRVLKFLREEYSTALNSAIDTSTGGQSRLGGGDYSQYPQTPGSGAETPFAAFPLDTSSSFTRKDSGAGTDYPWTTTSSSGNVGAGRESSQTNSPGDGGDEEEEVLSNAKRLNNMSLESISHSHSLPSSSTLQSTIQGTGTSSIFELLGHKDINAPDGHAAVSSRSNQPPPSLSSSFYGAFPTVSNHHHPHESSTPASGTQTPTSPSSQHAQTLEPSATYSPSHLTMSSRSAIANSTTRLLFRQGSSSNVASAAAINSITHKIEQDFSKKSGSLKPIFIDAISELLDELSMVREQIANQAMEHIHSAEIILTLGYSKTVEAFLKAAARKRKITVVVAETAPSYLGRQLALSLSAAGIPTLLVPDSGVYSLMSRISKVILGTHAVNADGSLVAISGTLPVCRAAKNHLVPVIVCTGMFKVTNEFGFNVNTSLEEWDNGSPAEVLSLSRDAGTDGNHDDAPSDDASSDLAAGEGLDEKILEQCQVITPYWDRVPQDLVDVYISNMGASPSSMIFRLLKELYE